MRYGKTSLDRWREGSRCQNLNRGTPRKFPSLPWRVILCGMRTSRLVLLIIGVVRFGWGGHSPDANLHSADNFASITRNASFESKARCRGNINNVSVDTLNSVINRSS
jgi:hypothetical protein